MEAEEARIVAMATNQMGAVSALLSFKAKLTGKMVERTEDLVKRDELERQRGRLWRI